MMKVKIFKDKKINLNMLKTRNIVWTVFGIIIMALFVMATTMITENSVTTNNLNVNEIIAGSNNFSSTKVGIGTLSPSSILDLYFDGSVDTAFSMKDTNNGNNEVIRLETATGNGLWALFDSSGNRVIQLRTDGNANYINISGKLGIGTNSPDTKVTIQGTASNDMFYSTGIDVKTSTNSYCAMWLDGGEDGRLDCGGSANAGMFINFATNKDVYMGYPGQGVSNLHVNGNIDVLNLTIGANSLLKLTANTTGIPCDVTTAGTIYYDGNLNKHLGCNSTGWQELY